MANREIAGWKYYSKTMLQLNRPWQATATTAPNFGKAAYAGLIRAMSS